MESFERFYKVKDLVYKICEILYIESIILLPLLNKKINSLCSIYYQDDKFRMLLEGKKFRGDEWMYINSISNKGYAEESTYCRHLKNIFFEKFTTQNNRYSPDKLYWIREWLGPLEKEYYIKQCGYLDTDVSPRIDFLVSLWNSDTFLPFLQRDDAIKYALTNKSIVVGFSSSLVGSIRLVLYTKNENGNVYCNRIRINEERHNYDIYNLNHIVYNEVNNFYDKHSIKNKPKISSYQTYF